jgi:hypothetical protein
MGLSNYKNFCAKLVCILTVTIALLSAPSYAQTYHVTDLGTINTNPQTGVVSSHPTEITNAGKVEGATTGANNPASVRVEDLRDLKAAAN